MDETTVWMFVAGIVGMGAIGLLMGVKSRSDQARRIEEAGRDCCNLCDAPLGLGLTRCPQCGFDEAVRYQPGLAEAYQAFQALNRAVGDFMRSLDLYEQARKAAMSLSRDQRRMADELESQAGQAHLDGLDSVEQAFLAMPALRSQMGVLTDELALATSLRQQLRGMLLGASDGKEPTS